MNSRHPRSRLALTLIVLALLLTFVLPAAVAGAQEEEANPVQFSGVIDAVAADAWIVAGQTVAITPQTTIQSQGTPEPGMWAAVHAAREDNGDLTARHINAFPPEMRLRGEVTVIPDGRLGEWTIGGQPFVVSENTRISERGGPITVGSWVQVAAVQSDDALMALRIRAIEPLPCVEVMGAIQAVDDASLVLSGVELALNEDTLIQGEPTVGLLAHAATELLPDNSLLAVRVRVMWQEQNQPHPPVTITGIIEELPEQGLMGRWVVDGVDVVVNRNTLINQRDGLAVVGAEVEIRGWEEEAMVHAREVVVITSPDPGGQQVRFMGPIQRLPVHGLLGIWQVAGHQVKVTQRAQIRGERFARVGAVAQVWGKLTASGQVLATEIVIRPPRPGEEVAEKAVLVLK